MSSRSSVQRRIPRGHNGYSKAWPRPADERELIPTELDLLDRRQFLLQRQHGREDIAMFLGPGEHFI